MIKSSNMYAVVVDGIIVEKGSAKKMQRLAKAMQADGRNAKVWNTPSKQVGEKIEG